MGMCCNTIQNLISQERDRWVLWLPIGMGVGICLYFWLPTEPAVWVGPLIFAIGGLSGLTLHKTKMGAPMGPMILAIMLTTVGLGVTAATFRTQDVRAIVLQRNIGPTILTGRIEKVETFPVGVRVFLKNPRISGLQPYQTPHRLSLRLRGKQPDFWPGDWIRVRAKLSSPSPPVAPGAFDFQRQAYFRGVGAVGFGLGQAQIVATTTDNGGDGSAYFIARLRHDITERITKALPGAKGGLAAALMTGEKKAVDKSIVQDLRDAGLAHLLSISGLHVGLVAGIIFAGLRLTLALISYVGLRYPIKKWAAVAAIVGAFLYALIAGATLPTQRAFLMLSFALVAVIVDRRGISMRSLAWAAVAVLLIQPESLLGPSFQMSFAAVMALIAVYEGVTLVSQRRHHAPTKVPHWLRTAALYVIGVGLTTLVAGLATAPYSAFHFNRIADYGLAANLIAVPITALWVMPWAVVAFVLMGLGLEGVALNIMGWGLDLVIYVSQTVSHWPGSITLIPAVPDWGLISISLGLIWLCLWQRIWRVLGVIPIVIGATSLLFVTPPDLLIDGQGKVIALRSDAGDLQFSTLIQAKRTREAWLRRAGQQKMGTFGLAATGHANHINCDITGCLYRNHQQTIAIVHSPPALIEDCWSADVVVSLAPVRRYCPAPLVIDRFDLWRKGTHALWITDNGIEVRTVNGGRGDRPWVLNPEKTRVLNPEKTKTAPLEKPQKMQKPKTLGPSTYSAAPRSDI